MSQSFKRQVALLVNSAACVAGQELCVMRSLKRLVTQNVPP